MNGHDENCACCKFNYPFDIPDYLLEDIQAGNCVVFAGAGISTESSKVLGWTFYDEVIQELGNKSDLSFPEAMSEFVAQPSGRMKLIEKLLKRFKYIDDWSDFRTRASSFHKELATMPYFPQVVTTNWDTYFEKYASMRPFVYDADISFWHASPRSVLKLHGSIENLSSIVATQDDYDDCFERLNTGLLGTILKQILATKTCIFIGYSLQDEDLRKILDSVGGQIGQFQKTHYFVTPMYSDGDLDDISIKAIPIITDGTFFLSKIKAAMVDKYCYADDGAYEAAFEILIDAEEVHLDFVENYSVTDHPIALCNIAYQDGVIHALQRIIDLRSSGIYSDLHTLQGVISRYNEIASEKKSKKAYVDYCYFTGYANGMFAFFCETSNFDNFMDEYFTAEEIKNLGELDGKIGVSMFFHPKLGGLTIDEYLEDVIAAPAVHKGALKECKKSIKTNGYQKGYIPQRMPFM